MANDRLTHVMPGCTIAHTSSGDLMFGIPSEVLKLLERKKITVPKKLVLPDEFFASMVIQAGCEFILYDFLFRQGGYGKGEKLTIIGTHEQCERMEKILRISLLGPTEELMRKWEISEDEIQLTLNMSKYFALPKRGTQEIAEIRDLVDFIEFDKAGQVMIDNVSIMKKSHNVFMIFDQGDETPIDINFFTNVQKPPIPIEHANGLAPHPVLGATAPTMCTTGFDKNGYTKFLILWLCSMGVVVDGVPFLKKFLSACGISHNEIKLHIQTHPSHDDHSNIYDLILNGQIFYGLGPLITYCILIYKCALILDIPESEVAKMIKWKVVPCTKSPWYYGPYNWYGTKFEFWRTAHPVPTFGFRATLKGKSIVDSADTVWGDRLTDCYAKVFPMYKEMYEWIMNVPNLASELTIHDMGGGMIHPNPTEMFQKLPEQSMKRIVPTHLPAVPDSLKDLIELIYPGQSWTIIKDNLIQTSDVQRIAAAPIFSNLSREWMNVVNAIGEIESYNRDDIILRQGDKGKKFYVILGGTASVLDKDGEEVATLSTGDFCGEISLMREINVTTTIKATSSIRLLAIDKFIFMEMCKSTGMKENLEKIHLLRPILINLFKDLPTHILNEVIQRGQTCSFRANEIIIKEGDVADRIYGIISGRAEVRVNGHENEMRRVASLYANQIFGEMALIEDETGSDEKKRNATVIAKTDVQVFYLAKKDFDDIIAHAPGFRYIIGVLARERRRMTPPTEK